MSILNSKVTPDILKIAISGILIFNLCVPYFCFEEKITYVQKTGEIKEGFPSDKEINFFWKITGICCDREGNLYVADAGWNKISKLNSEGRYIMSFGREGAGPGEFLGTARGRNLRISFGNDGNIYVMDHGAWRLSVFTQNGVFIKQFKLQPYTNDTPVVNSYGDIYLLSNSGVRVVDRYDSNFRFKASLFDFESHFQFPYWKPQSLTFRRKANERDVLKLITKDDHLVIISNFSLRVFVFDPNNKKINEFKIDEKGFEDDFKKRLKQLKEENKKLKKKARRGSGEVTSIFIVPFYAFLDNDDNLCLNYLRSDKVRVIYRYKIDGAFLGTWILPNDASIVKCSNNQGYLFSPLELNTKIGIYSISLSAKGEKSHIK